ncbi:PTS HPr component phosphorylation site [Lachnospiraceae bacterium A10]|jgi:phosphotransferase system HPr-like phosphotransfer protein|nr:PTS HPr component phosphorylation site [Lachnospiraceae bacterium A10]
MKKFKILLNSPDDVQEFVKIASQYPFDIDLEHGSVYIDAKSLLGVLTMGINRKLDVICGTQDEKFFSSVKKFAVV